MAGGFPPYYGTEIARVEQEINAALSKIVEQAEIIKELQSELKGLKEAAELSTNENSEE